MCVCAAAFIGKFPTTLPIHPTSATMHESVLAVRQLYGLQTCNAYQTLLLERRNEFVDALTMDLSRNQIARKLSELAAEVDGVDCDAVEGMLKVDLSAGQNSGSSCFRMLRFYVKQHRQLGIHVSPTCRVNGLEVDTSSGWTLEEWRELLDPMVEAAKGGWFRL